MEFDLRWEALVKPGKGTHYFGRHAQHPFESNHTGFSMINAWWLSELSRWVYKQEDDETGRLEFKNSRKRILDPIGLKEEHFISSRLGTQCALVVPANEHTEPFAVLVFRGSHEIKDWITNFTFFPARWSGPGRVHRGFRNALDSVWAKVDTWLDQAAGPVFYTGHSLGAALATLAAVRRPPTALYTFGGPLVGNRTFARTLSQQSAYRIVHHRDIVTIVPPPFLGYAHGASLHYLTHDGRLQIDPARRDVSRDRRHRPRDGKTPIRRRRGCSGPPGPMSDHAPVNYVARLERLV